MTTQSATRSTWATESSHASADFAVKHLMISTVKGRFTELEGTFELDEGDLTNSSGTLTIKAASLETHDERRDEHLRSADFFDAATYPELRFESRRIEREHGNDYRIIGDLTVRGITREVELKAEVTGPVRDPMAGERLGLSAETKINRKDFGLNWNMALETGGFIVGDEVKVTVNLELVKQA